MMKCSHPVSFDCGGLLTALSPAGQVSPSALLCACHPAQLCPSVPIIKALKQGSGGVTISGGVDEALRDVV